MIFQKVGTCLFFLTILVGGVMAQETSSKDPLVYGYTFPWVYDQLFHSYSKLVPPANMNVTLDLTISKVIEVNVRKGIVTLQGYLGQLWYDNRLAYFTPPVHKIITPDDVMFLPDILLYNGLERKIAKVNKVIEPTGYVYYFTPTRWEVFCDVDRYPTSKSIECKMSFGSWAYDISQIDVKPRDDDPTIRLDEYNEKSLCKITSSRAEREAKRYECCPNKYSQVHFFFNVSCQTKANQQTPKERSARDVASFGEESPELLQDNHKFSTTLPNVISPFLILVVYLLPPTSGERIIFSAIVFASLLIQLNSGNLTSSQGQFLTFGTFLSVVSTFLAVLPIFMMPYTQIEISHVTESKERRKFRVARLIDVVLFVVFAVALAVAAYLTFKN